MSKEKMKYPKAFRLTLDERAKLQTLADDLTRGNMTAMIGLLIESEWRRYQRRLRKDERTGQ